MKTITSMVVSIVQKSKAFMSKNFIGYLGEKFAIMHYQLSFHKLVKSRYKSKLGEIDAILIKGEHIIFLEVKTRLTTFDLKNVISFSQKQRIKNSVKLFMTCNSKKYSKYSPRIDLFIVTLGKPIIIKNAW